MARGDARIITSGDISRKKILDGAKVVYDAVAAVYGPTSGNVAIQKPYGYPTITHDGVSVAREVYLADEEQDMGAGLLVQASSKSNDISGDGTSATVMLAYHIIAEANKSIAAGFKPMKLRRGIDKAANWLKDELDAKAVKVADSKLAQVATISASDPEVGKLVADTVVASGGVGITVEEYDGLGVLQEIVDGLYFESGWSLPHFVTDRTSEEAVQENVSILLLEKSAKQNQDIVPIIEMVYRDTEHKTLLIVGKVDGQALETCALTNQLGKVKICVVKPPVYGDQELPFLEDVGAMTGGDVIPSSMAAANVAGENLGFAKKIIVTRDSTTIFGGAGSPDSVAKRIKDLKVQLKSDKYSKFQKERMEMRLAKLNGKIGIIRVGGATEAEQKELKYRVDDAVHATRAAQEEGVIPGGGTTMARLSKWLPQELSDKDESEGANIVLRALVEPFKQLMVNAGEDGGHCLAKVLEAPDGTGFDVRNMTEDPIDLMKAGIVDPVKVIKSVVENACSVAGIAITIPTLITFDREWVLQQHGLNKAQQGG